MKYLTVDSGSTYTKLTAIDTERGDVIGTAAAFTTIETDVMRDSTTACSNSKPKWDTSNTTDCSVAAVLREV